VASRQRSRNLLADGLTLFGCQTDDTRGSSQGERAMRQLVLAIATIITVATIAPARADMVGAAAGAGSGLLIAGPVGAVAGGVIGGVYGRPFWGPPVSPGACWVDNNFRRHCSYHRYHRY
jgi:osmotically inducible lipoprotein OsmB